MGLWTYTLRELARRPGKSLFTLSGIAIGVAAAVAALATSDAARGRYTELFEGLAGRSALEVFAPGEVGFDPAVADSLLHIPGVRATLPEVQATGGLPSWRSSAAVVVRASRPGDGPTPRDDEVLVPDELLEAHGLRVGGRLRLWGTAGQGNYLVSRLPPDAARKVGGGFVVVSLPTAQHLFGLGEKINLVRLVLHDGADPETVRAAVAAQLPPGLQVRDPAGRADITRSLRAAASYGLTGLTAVALAAAGYIVFGLAQLNLLARRSELAILRTLGASTRHVEGILLRHALVLGFCGGVAGTLGGALLAWAFLGGSNASAGLALASPRLSWESIGLGLLLGVGLSVCAVWLPARSVCRTPPLALLRASAQSVPGGAVRGQFAPIALFCLALGTWVLAECSARRFSPAVGRIVFPPALVLVLAGLMGLVAPRLPALLARLERPVRFLFGVEGGLAVRLLGRRPERSARACGVGFITVTMVIGFGHTVLNSLADVRTWTRRAIPADLLVRGAQADPGFVLNVALPESLGDDLRALEGVACVDRITFISSTVNGTPAIVLARTFTPEQPLPVALRTDEADVIRQGLARGEVVLAEGLASALRVGVGDCISLDTPLGPRSIRVAGVVVEYAAGGAALYLDWNAAASLFGPFGVHVFLLTLQEERKAAAEAAVERYCAARGLVLQRNRELQKAVDELTRGLTGGLWALLAVMIVIAALGVVNAVLSFAIEQRHDVQILRMIGMATRRIRSTFRLQATFLALVGVPGGVVCGVALALALDHTIRGLWGYSVPFQIQWEFLLWSVGNALFVGILAGFTLPVLSRSGVAK
jgi:putative ABC transport system permease protein